MWTNVPGAFSKQTGGEAAATALQSKLWWYMCFVAVLGVSVDPQPAKTAWAKEIGVKSFDLLSDNYPYGEVAKKYGVFREKDGISERAVFVIDKSGKVTWSKVYDIPQQPANSDIFDALAALPRS